MSISYLSSVFEQKHIRIPDSVAWMQNINKLVEQWQLPRKDAKNKSHDSDHMAVMKQTNMR